MKIFMAFHTPNSLKYYAWAGPYTPKSKGTAKRTPPADRWNTNP